VAKKIEGPSYHQGVIDEAKYQRRTKGQLAGSERKIGQVEESARNIVSDRSEGVMKNFGVKESCIGLDRLATWDEVRYAMELSSQSAWEPGCTLPGYDEVEFDAAGLIGGPPEKLAWLELLQERLDPKSN
jgi:hypothetical protein